MHFRFTPARLLWAILLLLGLVTAPLQAQTKLSAAAGAPGAIVVLYSYGDGLPAYAKFGPELRSFLTRAGVSNDNLYFEYLDLQRGAEGEYRRQLVQLLRQKFTGQQVDLVLTVHGPALDFLLNEARDLFPNQPVISLLGPRTVTPATAHRIALRPMSLDFDGTLELALKLFPDTRRVVFVAGTGAEDRTRELEAREAFAASDKKVEFEYTSDLSVKQMLDRVAALPPQTVVLYASVYADKTGQKSTPKEIAEKIARAANAPVFGFFDTLLGTGAVGGSMLDFRTEAKEAGQLALDILNGKVVLQKPVTIFPSGKTPMFDWEQTRRWRIHEQHLPAGSMVINRPPSLWGQFRKTVIGALALGLLQLLLIFALFVQIRRKTTAQKALRESEERFRVLVEQAPEAIAVLDLDTFRFVDANAKAERLFGCSREQLLRSDILRFYPPEQPDGVPLQDSVRAHAEEALAGKPVLFERTIRNAQGKNASCEVWLVRLPSAGRTLLRASLMDITERKRAEEALRQSEEQLRSFVEHAPYGITRESVTDDKYLRVNPAFVRMLGYSSEDELLARKLSTEIYSSPEAHRNLLAQLRQNERFRGVELEFKRKDGKLITLRASGHLRQDPFGRGEVIEGIVEDVTQQRQLEEQLRQAQKMEAVGRLAGGVAHDFNNLLGVILGYSELLERDLAPDSALRKKVEAIRGAGERAASLTAQLLAVSRRQVLRPSVLNLNSVVSDTDKMLRSLIREDVELKLALHPELRDVKADPGQMMQVIMNLAVNARDAMPDGGTLMITTDNVEFERDMVCQGVAVRAGRYVLLAVSDTGVGMDPETRARMFEPFFTTKPAGQGTGLGLATVYGIVTQSAGYIFADSEIGRGTTFRIFLPQVDKVHESAHRPQAPVAALGGSETILLVEDAMALREIIRESLQAVGYRVLLAANGADALEIARQHDGPIHLLITDVVMPQMSGPELAQRIASTRPEIPVLYMSGYADTLARFRALHPDVVFIQKPFALGALSQKVREVLTPR